MQERLESSVVGRVLLSILIVVVLAGVISWNLPGESDLGRRSQYRLKPVVNAVGLDQTWAVFAPDPPRQEFELEARIAYADGTERVWRVPTGNPIVGAYRDYRWLKWAEWVTGGAHVLLMKPAAAWIARQERLAGRQPVSVTLVRQVFDLPIGRGRTSPRPTDLYVYRVSDGDAGAPDVAPP
ncbi:MAG: hypothetical protein M3179_12095 [Actinomycetota bacterium]|nr:hypothetical protein [Actinomycetota bacterium]